MDDDTSITPEEYVERVATLVTSGRNEEALAFAERVFVHVLPHLTAEQLQLTSSLMHMAQMTVDLEEAYGEHEQAKMRRTS